MSDGPTDVLLNKRSIGNVVRMDEMRYYPYELYDPTQGLFVDHERRPNMDQAGRIAFIVSCLVATTEVEQRFAFVVLPSYVGWLL